VSTERRYPLAYDVDGNPLAVPETAVAWRVRRGGGQRGRPRNVYDTETGAPLEVPLDATIDDLLDRGCGSGRYRLEAVDTDGRAIAGVVAATEIGDGAGATDGGEAPKLAQLADCFGRMTDLIGRLVDSNCRAMEALASGYGPVRPPRAPFVVEEPAAGGEAMRPDELMQSIAGIAKGVAEAFKGPGANAGGGA